MSLNESPNLEQSALRLPTLSTTPSVDKLREALRLASNNVQNIIELPWKSTNSPVNYMIKVGCQPNQQEPAWILHVGGEADDAILWNYNTADCQMIYGLIAAEVERAAYAAAGSSQPVPVPAGAAPAPPQIIEQAAPPHVSQSAQQPPVPPQNQKPGYDWGSGQAASQQGQDWNWSSPTAAANANWSTSSHLPLNAPPEPIVPINDPQAFSQSWGAPSPAISAPDSGPQRSTKPQGPMTPETKPPESSIFLSGPLAQGNHPAGKNPASQTQGLPQMSPVESLAPSPTEPATVLQNPFAQAAVTPAPEVSAPTMSVSQSAPVSAALSTSVPLALSSGVLPTTPGEGPSLPIGGFAHSTPFSMTTMPAPVMPTTIDDALPGLATLDSVPVLDAASVDGALHDHAVVEDDNENVAVLSGNSQPPPVVPSGRKFSSTMSATLPLNAQETMTPDEENLTAPRIDAADLGPAPPPEASPPSMDAPPVESSTKQSNKKKGRGSKLNLPAIKAPDEAAGAVDQETVESVVIAESPDAVPEPPFNPVSLFEDEPIPAPIPVPLPPPPAFVAPLSIDLSAIPPLPAIADFSAAAIQPIAAPSPPPFVVEFDPAEPSASQQAPVEELDPTVPLAVASGDDIGNSRLLHEPPVAVADLVPASESPPPPLVSDQPDGALPKPPEVAAIPVVALVEQLAPVESAPKRALPPPAPFNREAVDVIFKHLTNEETGFITNSAFMFFIVREFSRFQKAQTPVTLIGFELALRAPDGAMYPVHLAALRECGRRFFSVMRPLDWLAHYSDDEFALLLPHTNIREAILLVKNLYTVLNQGALLPGMEDAQVVMHCGIASIPEDCQHPGILIAAAYEAKNEAKRSNLALQLFRDMPA